MSVLVSFGVLLIVLIVGFSVKIINGIAMLEQEINIEKREKAGSEI